MRKAYICERYPGLKIGSIAQFSGGLLFTEDPSVQAAVEGCQTFRYGKITLLPEGAIPDPLFSNTPSGITRIARDDSPGSRLPTTVAPPVVKPPRPEAPPVVEEGPFEMPSKTALIRMNRGELLAVAKKANVAVAPGLTNVQVRALLRSGSILPKG
jgi:hypothetical protein